MEVKYDFLCKYLGGSHLYGYNNENSDKDERGLVINTEPSFILGTKRFEQKVVNTTKEDIVYRELRHFCTLLRKGNTESLEILFCDKKAFTFYDDRMDLFRDTNKSFLDSKVIFNSLRGYIKAEYNRSMFKNDGTGRSAQAIDKYGFDPKNMVQLIRLAFTGIILFEEDKYVVNIKDFPKDVAEFIVEVKNQPDTITNLVLINAYNSYEKRLVKAFENRKVNHTFDEDLINTILLKCYHRYLIPDFDTELESIGNY